MSEQHLNIVTFNIPYPPDYGGVMDVFYKIKALHAAGVKVHLHCIDYKEYHYAELENICAEINYYKRKTMWKGFFSDKPFIVSSRSIPQLKHNLLQNDHAILFEGLHCCAWLDDPALKHRVKIVRMHNDEANYYLNLAKHEKGITKKLYFYEEYRRLFRYEKILQYADHILCIAKHEADQYAVRYTNVSYLAPFHGNNHVSCITGKGDYAIYHGNLSVNENAEAVLFLLRSVFYNLPYALHIYGKSPSAELKAEVRKNKLCVLVEDPSAEQLDKAMHNAQIHVLPAFTETGVKLKLLQALFKGRFCIANTAMIKGTGLEKYCTVKDSAAEMQQAVEQMFEMEFTADDITYRKNIEQEFSDSTEVQKIIELLNTQLPL